MLPRQPWVDAAPIPHWGHVSSEDNKTVCLNETGRCRAVIWSPWQKLSQPLGSSMALAISQPWRGQHGHPDPISQWGEGVICL